MSGDVMTGDVMSGDATTIEHLPRTYYSKRSGRRCCAEWACNEQSHAGLLTILQQLQKMNIICKQW